MLTDLANDVADLDTEWRKLHVLRLLAHALDEADGLRIGGVARAAGLHEGSDALTQVLCQSPNALLLFLFALALESLHLLPLFGCHLLGRLLVGCLGLVRRR